MPDQGGREPQPEAPRSVLVFALPILFVAVAVAAFVWAPGFAWFFLLFGGPVVAIQTKRLVSGNEDQDLDGREDEPAG